MSSSCRHPGSNPDQYVTLVLQKQIANSTCINHSQDTVLELCYLCSSLAYYNKSKCNNIEASTTNIKTSTTLYQAVNHCDSLSHRLGCTLLTATFQISKCHYGHKTRAEPQYNLAHYSTTRLLLQYKYLYMNINHMNNYYLHAWVVWHWHWGHLAHKDTVPGIFEVDFWGLGLTPSELVKQADKATVITEFHRT